MDPLHFEIIKEVFFVCVCERNYLLSLFLFQYMHLTLYCWCREKGPLAGSLTGGLEAEK